MKSTLRLAVVCSFALLGSLAACNGTRSVVGRRPSDAGVTADKGMPDVLDVPDVVDVPDAPDVVDVSDVVDVPDVPAGPRARVIVECGTVCRRPLDAVLDAMGRTVYFTGYTAMRVPAVFRATVPAVGAPAATPTPVVTGMGLSGPMGIAISNDDMTLYVADISALRSEDPNDDVGAVFSIPVAGGAPFALTLASEFVHPSGVAVAPDGMTLVIAAQRRTTMGNPFVVFRLSRGGGSATVLATATHSPAGVSQSSSGAVAWFDTRHEGPTVGAVRVVNGMMTAELATGLAGNFPSGLAYALDGRTVLVAAGSAEGRTEERPGVLSVIDADGGVTSPMALSMGMVSPSGLHRARMVDAWAVADDSAGENGQVFLVTLQ